MLTHLIFIQAKFLLSILLSVPIYAMVSSNTVGEHRALAYNSPNHQSAALICDQKLKFIQSGVLIRDNIVITAAHGMQMLLDANYPMQNLGSYILITPEQMTVTFSKDTDQEISYTVDCVLLDSRYVKFDAGDQPKFDIAFLKLSQPVSGIEPVRLSDEVTLEPDNPMLVITWGNADISDQKIKRAFYLYEWSLFFPNKDEDSLANFRTVMLSSLFFDPAENLPPKPDINDSESAQRRYFAIKSWLTEKRPYGLALPGTSGAPVFVEVRKNGGTEFYLFGLVMGYSGLGEEAILLPSNSEDFAKNPAAAYNKYQTILTTPFRLNMQPTANMGEQKHFKLDKRYLKFIDDLLNDRKK